MSIQSIIPIASGKGGVGKSTVSANLALALAQKGLKVGLMDADVYGPSIPTILGVTEKPQTKDNRIIPPEKFGLKIISMGFFIPAGEAVIWRGPMLHKMVNDFLKLVEWGDLDILVVDLPPGTGDIQLSLCQTISVTGAVIVSTPQEVAWNVAKKAIMMFDKLNTPVLGIIENMSYYKCGHCGEREELFGSGGARRAAEMMEIPFLGEIPLIKAIRSSADAGDPVVHSEPQSESAKNFIQIAENLISEIKGLQSRAQTKIVPSKIGPAGQSEIMIEWSDGRLSIYKPKDLRTACPCASCVNELTGKRILNPASVPDTVRATALNSVGRYALQIVWSDGHGTGIYAFDKLRKLG